MTALSLAGRVAPGVASRNASTGSTLVALRAGMSAAATVTVVPTIIDTRIVRELTCRDVVGRLNPSAETSAFRPLATPAPTAMPTAEAITPSSPASTSKLVITCRRVAPIARISAISRLRWATIIVNVFQMMNEPTNNAMAAKVVNNTLTKPNRCLITFDASAPAAAPVTAGTDPSRIAVTKAESSARNGSACPTDKCRIE